MVRQHTTAIGKNKEGHRGLAGRRIIGGLRRTAQGSIGNVIQLLKVVLSAVSPMPMTFFLNGP